MTISISQQAFDELWEEMQAANNTQHPDPDDKLDLMYRFIPQLARGYCREIQLREGLLLTIGDYRVRDRIISESSECDRDCIEYHFHISGENLGRQTFLEGGRYSVYGKGVEAKSLTDISNRQPFLEVIIEITT